MARRVKSSESIDGYVDLLQISTPSNPAASYGRLYRDSSNVLHMLSSAGAEGSVLPLIPLASITGGASGHIQVGTITNANVSSSAAIVYTKLDPISIPADKTADYTLVLADANRSIGVSSATAKLVTIPPNSSVAFRNGDTVEIRQVGAGQVTWTAGAGVTIRSRGTALKTAGQYAMSTAIKVGTDEWYVSGDLTT